MQFANAVKDEAFTVSLGKTFHSIKLLFLGIGEFIIVSESEWDFKSLLVDMTTSNLAQWLQIYQLQNKSFTRKDSTEKMWRHYMC